MRSWRQVKNKWTKTSPSDYLKLVRKHKYKHSLISTYMSRYFPMNANPPSLPFSCRNIFLWMRTYSPRRFPINEKPNQSQMTFLCPLPSFFSVFFFFFFLFPLFWLSLNISKEFGDHALISLPLYHWHLCISVSVKVNKEKSEIISTFGENLR